MSRPHAGEYGPAVDRMFSDLHVWSPEGRREAGAGVIEEGRSIAEVSDSRVS